MMYKLFFQVYYSILLLYAIHFVHIKHAHKHKHTPDLMQEADERASLHDERASLHELHGDLDSPS